MNHRVSGKKGTEPFSGLKPAIFKPVATVGSGQEEGVVVVGRGWGLGLGAFWPA